MSGIVHSFPPFHEPLIASYLFMEPLAQKICFNVQISGVTIGHREHKVNLFADNLILILSMPTPSLEAVQLRLKDFGSISYYKVNDSKSSILGLNVPPDVQSFITSHFPYSWAKQSITYLGVQLTANTNSTFQENYSPFLQSLQMDLLNISKFTLSWMGNLAAFKMPPNY